MSDTGAGPRDFGFADDAHRYRLDGRIATGGMGEVWRATDTTLGREVAVKLLKTEYADDATFRSRFETEARHAAALHHHGVAAIYDVGESELTDGSGVHRPFLVMELVDGQPLSALLRPGSPMDADATRDLLAQAADAIGAAHAAGIVHRDVKPANLMITPDRQVKITDFGIARAAEGLGLTETGQVMGTPQYLSPEQARGESATAASDVYSLGVVAFECLAGRRPFVGETPVTTALAHLREPVPELPSDVPADLAAVVRRALAKAPRDRFPDGAAFATALRDPATAAVAIAAAGPPAEQTRMLDAVPAAAGVPLAAGPDTPAYGTPTPTRRRRSAPIWWVLAALILLALLLVGAYALTRGDSTAPTDTPRDHPSRSHSPSVTPSTTPSTSPSTQPASPSSSAPTSPTSTAPPSTSAPASPTAPTSTAPTAPASSTAPASPAASTSSAPAAAGTPSSSTAPSSPPASVSSPGTTNGRGVRP